MTEASETPRVEIVSGDPTDEELAALIAVVSEAYVTETQEAVAATRQVSVWQATRRGLRRSLNRDIPWGRYSG